MIRRYDLILCGTGFASSFFLVRWKALHPTSKVLVLERGRPTPYADMLATRTNSTFDADALHVSAGLDNKLWRFTIGMGGGSNCWWGQTPRFLPEDFALRSRFGVGYDWPITYSDLEPFYEDAEEMIVVAGDKSAPYPRRSPCPQPAHPMSSFDQQLVAAFPNRWFPTPTARSSQGTAHRGRCCSNGVCNLCPVDAKFRVMNEMAALYAPSGSTELITGADVHTVDIEGGRAVGVMWTEGEREYRARGELVFLGMNALFNANVLLRSTDTSPLTGKRLGEQASKYVQIDFANIKNFNGSSHISSLGYLYYSGNHRRNHAAALIESTNAPPMLRSTKGKWTSRAVLKVVAENLPEDRNLVQLGDKPTALFIDHSDYAKQALDKVPNDLISILGKISHVENAEISDINPSEGHIMGTTVMSRSATDGVVDHLLRHHRIGNLLVGGSGVFPSFTPSNPSLTIAALSLRSADKLLASAA